MAGFWGKRKREQEAQQAAQDADLARSAQTALVTTDERIRIAQDELAFAEAELGNDLTADLRNALDSVRTHMGEAFHLHQLNHDHIPDTAEELRTRNARIVQLCEWAEALLEEKTETLKDKINLVRRAPEIIAQVRSDADALQTRIAPTRATIERLGARYADSAMAQVAASADEAEQLLAFARHSAEVTERRREARRNAEANLALETATEAVRRARAVIEAVEDFEINALRAESTLSDVAADSRADIVAARNAPQTPAVVEATAALQAAVGALAPLGGRNDPFAELTMLREANERLEQAVATARHRELNPLPSVAQVQHAFDDADQQIAVARSLIAGHRGWIGADARTRLAEAERLRLDARALLPAEETREAALHNARRVAHLAAEALQLAQRDIDSARPPQHEWGGRGNTGGNGLATGILGGFVIGSLLDGIFD